MCVIVHLRKLFLERASVDLFKTQNTCSIVNTSMINAHKALLEKTSSVSARECFKGKKKPERITWDPSEGKRRCINNSQPCNHIKKKKMFVFYVADWFLFSFIFLVLWFRNGSSVEEEEETCLILDFWRASSARESGRKLRSRKSLVLLLFYFFFDVPVRFPRPWALHKKKFHGKLFSFLLIGIFNALVCANVAVYLLSASVCKLLSINYILHDFFLHKFESEAFHKSATWAQVDSETAGIKLTLD